MGDSSLMAIVMELVRRAPSPTHITLRPHAVGAELQVSGGAAGCSGGAPPTPLTLSFCEGMSAVQKLNDCCLQASTAKLTTAADVFFPRGVLHIMEACTVEVCAVEVCSVGAYALETCTVEAYNVLAITSATYTVGIMKNILYVYPMWSRLTSIPMHTCDRHFI